MRQPIENPNIVIFIFTITGLFVLFSLFTVIHLILYRQKQRTHRLELETSKKDFEEQLQKAQIEVQENTYRHIAKDLHDNVGQLLGTTKMLLGITELKYSPVPETLLSANSTLARAMQELRLVSRSLDREWLEQFNFLEILQTEVDRVNEGGTIKAELDCTTSITLEPQEQVILFRIVQEAIQNAIRHADPTRITISIYSGKDLTVKVTNNGKALPSNFHGMGTTNMRQRAHLFGGSVEWHSSTQTTVTVSIPLKN